MTIYKIFSTALQVESCQPRRSFLKWVRAFQPGGRLKAVPRWPRSGQLNLARPFQGRGWKIYQESRRGSDGLRRVFIKWHVSIMRRCRDAMLFLRTCAGLERPALIQTAAARQMYNPLDSRWEEKFKGWLRNKPDLCYILATKRKKGLIHPHNSK